MYGDDVTDPNNPICTKCLFNCKTCSGPKINVK